jgi:hypothetical protein
MLPTTKKGVKSARVESDGIESAGVKTAVAESAEVKTLRGKSDNLEISLKIFEASVIFAMELGIESAIARMPPTSETT